MFAKFALIALIAVSAPQNAARSGRSLVDEGQLGAAGLVKYWEANLPLGEGDRIGAGYLIDEALYVITRNSNAYALKADVGLLRWVNNLTEPDYKVFPPTHVRRADGAGPVIFPTTTATLVFDRFSGELVGQFTPEFATGSAAAAYDNLLFMGSTGGRFYSMIYNNPRLGRPVIRWDVLVRGPVTAAPVLYDRDNLIVASHGGVVVSCRGGDKTLNWSFETGGAILADPVVDGDGVYVASLDRSLYKLSKSIGIRLWQARFPRPLEASPIAIGDTVFQFCPGHGLTALNAVDGTERWRHPTARAFAAHSSAGDIVLTDNGTLEVLDHATGDVRASVDAPAVINTVPNPFGPAVYLLGTEGRVLALQLDSVPYLRRQQIMAARKQLNLPPVDESSQIKPVRPAESGDESDSDPFRSRRDIPPKDGG